MKVRPAGRYANPAMKSGAQNDDAGDQEASAKGRIAVVRDRHLVPLLGSSHEHGGGAQPWKGVLLEHHVVRPGEIPQHEHPELCLHLQLSGNDDFEWWSGCRNAVERTRPGSLILIAPGTSDRLRWKGTSERVIASVSEDALASLARELGARNTPEFRGGWSLQDASLERIVAEMGQEAQEGWPLGRLYADLLALGFETQLLRSHGAEPIAPPSLKGGLSMPKLRRAMEYINANLAGDVRLEGIAEELGLSASHFAHEFRKSTGQTPYQYLLEQRIAKARVLLSTTRWPVQYISGLAGFRSPVNFVRTFRQRMGATPDAWRRSQ